MKERGFHAFALLPLVMDVFSDDHSGLSLKKYLGFFFRLRIFSFKQPKMLVSSMTVCAAFLTQHCHWPQLSALKIRFQCLYGERKQKTMVKPSNQEFVSACCLVCEMTIFCCSFVMCSISILVSGYYSN